MDYTGTYDSWGNTTSQVRDGITRTLKYDGQDHLVRWSSSVNSQQEWNPYDGTLPVDGYAGQCGFSFQ